MIDADVAVGSALHGSRSAPRFSGVVRSVGAGEELVAVRIRDVNERMVPRTVVQHPIDQEVAP